MREKQKGPPVLEHRRANQGDGLTTHHQKFNTELEDLQMKKKITGNVLSAGAIVLGLAAVGCGGAIENAANGWVMLGYTLLAIVLGCAALALAGLGTAAELKDKGLFGSEGTVHECYRKRGGVYKPGGVTRMEMELCQKRIRHPMKLPDQPAKVKRKPIGGVIDPSALAYDVHDLMIYNEKARKIGKPELTYGYWAEKGKPATP